MRKAFIFTAFLTVTLSSFAFQKQSKKDYLVTISTPYGEMKAILYDDTPLHKANFIKLIEDGFYDSLLFHRVIKDFMIQGGDPDSKGAVSGQSLGRGGPGYRVDAEIRNNHYHKKGVLAAARTGDAGNPERKSSGSQFYIVQGDSIPTEQLKQQDKQAVSKAFNEWAGRNRDHEIVVELTALYEKEGFGAIQKWVDENLTKVEELTGRSFNFPEQRYTDYAEIGGAPHLDRQYTVFGEVIVGLEVIDKIAEVETNRSDRPNVDVPMTISVERLKKKKITKLYGYAYPQ